MANSDEKEKKVSFKETLNLPTTDFPIRPNAKIDDPEMIKRWESEKLYEKTYASHKGEKKFVLHDGPPYANGHIHLGTAYNKILKDLVTKFHRMRGMHVPVTPGWDCHGLPIELRVAQENPGLSPLELKKACRASARKWIDIQKEEFKRLGVLMDWEHPYLTMNPDYEASTIRALGAFVDKGYIERKNKTVAWCPSCQTVLATAEIEYKERKDPSIYTLFPLSTQDAHKLMPQLGDKQLYLTIWTTTPWTLPLNRAVLAHPDTNYQILKMDDRYFIVGAEVSAKIDNLLEGKTELVATLPAAKLNGIRVRHPFISGLTVPIIFDPSVELNEGTAFVHCAPGAGPLDYEIGVKNKLEIFAPVGPDGNYTANIEPVELAGMNIADAQGWVMKKLAEEGRLLAKKSITHSYPHCWRCRNGLIFRATKQWFINLQHDELKQKALDAIDEKIKFVPETGKNFLRATVGNRWEWCISRQRVWGTPIPALICMQCDTAHISKKLIENVARGVEKEGVEYWDRVSVDELVEKDFICTLCKSTQFKKEGDILDVWFDSGVSHYAVLYTNRERGLFPADMYLEGIDQHRGWFQSSLLTSLVVEGEPCMRTIVTHGFTVDAKGQKMSKSLGNVIAPLEIIEKLGTDCLRLWVSSIDIEGDAVVSDTLLNNVAEVFRKIRNTLRFLLSNLYDFDKAKDGIKIEHMTPLDRYALERLYEVQESLFYYYEREHFTGVFHELGEYVSAELSSFYLDIIKDRLYVEKSEGDKRRSAQTACWYILDSLMRLIAPIMSFTAEQISDHFQKNKTESIHLQEFAPLRELKEWLNRTGIDFPHHLGSGHQAAHQIRTGGLLGSRNPQWNTLKTVRNAVLKAIEKLREQDIIKHSLEAHLRLHFDTSKKSLEPIKTFLNTLRNENVDAREFLKEFLIVSQVTIDDEKETLEPTDVDGLSLAVTKASGVKCPRCWHWDETQHEHGLCKRCQNILEKK